jgi:asparagine synthase (glutamine-hydrolysing)
MCGIAGRVNLDRPVSARQLDAMSGLLAHRGPDGAGVWRDGRAGLAHRRLAIVDLEGGRQPVLGEGGRVALVYNGEVMNHLELRRELEPLGHRFADHCDTEAVLHAHEEWGVAAAPRLRGMFAYAAWESDHRRLTLVRDHVGIKPLYYAHLPSGDLLFSSELKALLVEPQVDRTLDDEALGAYLSLRYVPAPMTILRGVRKLEPGCALVWQDGRVVHHRWWQPAAGDARDVPPPPPTFAEAAGRLCTLLEEVVGMWRMGDVPLGAFLSGGLDSTLVTAILVRLARRHGDPIPCTFSVGYAAGEGDGADELEWARRAAVALGTRHRELRISGREVGAALQQIAWHLDEPLGDPAAVPLWFLTRRARAEVTIALSGEGADEVFGGYEAYRHALVAAKLRALPGAAALAGAAARWLPVGRLRRGARMVAVPIEQRYRGVARAFDDALRPAWGNPDAVTRALAPSWERAGGAPTALGRLLAFDQQVWLADDLLVKADKMTMAHALELRPPLLDVRLMEEVAGWPDAWKHDGRVGKRILRAAARGVVPDAILDRPKNGFGTPAAAWLRGALRERAHDLLLGPGSLACDREDGELVAQLLAQHAAGVDRTSELWTLLSLEAWRDAVVGHVHVVHSVDVHVVHTAEPRAAAGSLVILLLDPDEERSPLSAAARRAGHRLVVAGSVEAAELVLASLMPDVILVRAQSPESDRVALARLEHIAPEVPVRVLDAPDAFESVPSVTAS